MRVEYKAGLFLLILCLCMYLWLLQERNTASFHSEIQQEELKEQVEEKTKTVTLQRGEEIVKLDLETYLKGVVGSEMTPSYEMEALKAQAVAARTFVASRNYKVDDTTASQVYLDDSQLKAAWKGQYETSKERIAEAVDATKGEIMVVDGKPITSFFFASSGGKTANSEEYYSSALSYLRSVDSPWDADIDQDYVTTFRCSKQELAHALGKSSISEIEAPIFYDSGYVKAIMIDGQEYSGRTIREALQLKSSCFHIAVADDEVTFTVYGSGHGVGMSQEGAQGMAKEGYDYKAILEHYYSGIEWMNVYKS